MPREFAIPDIHGRRDLLEMVWRGLLSGKVGAPLADDDLVVFLGDMVDRGPASSAVVAFIRNLVENRPNTVALLGNHEQFVLDAYRGPEHERRSTVQCWHRPNNGGAMTEASYNGIVPDDVLDWLESLPLSHETDLAFYSHAPVPRESYRKVFMRGQPYSKEELIWTYHADEFGVGRSLPGKVGVCGHLHKLRDGVFTPRLYPHYLFLDAGCGCHARAPLVVCDVGARKWWGCEWDGFGPVKEVSG